LVAAAIVACAVAFASCNKPAATVSVTTTAGGQRFNSVKDLNPAIDLEPTAQITSAGTSRAMTIHTQHGRGEYTITIEHHGEIYDEEVYKDSPGYFSLFEAAGEHYSLPIPLLKFPMTVGQSWNWEGSAEASGEAVEAKATITTSEEQVYVCGVALQAVKSNVKLVIGGPSSTVREMNFYFSPKRGLFKREYGNISIREPDCP
jgi:hypothetical protein